MSEITVLMPVYNGMPHLVEAVESILDQTFKDFTFLIINDGSSDGTESYLRSLKDDRLWIIHQENLGLGATLNKGIMLCKTEFLARMDADDICLPKRLELQYKFMKEHKEIGMLGTQFSYMGFSGKPGFAPPLPLTHDDIYKNLFLCRHALSHPSLLFRTAIIQGLGGYQVEGIGEDWDMFLRMGEATRIANLDESLYLYRLNNESVSVKQLTEVRLRYNHACHCAKQRAAEQPEISYEEFLEEQNRRPLVQRIGDVMDIYAVGQYRQAMAEILNDQYLIGYLRLVWSALSSPRWTLQRVYRELTRMKDKFL